MTVERDAPAWQEVEDNGGRISFQANVRVRPDMAPVVPAEGREGELIGSAEGEVRGAIRGTMRVTFYSAECVLPRILAGILVSPGVHVCRENPGGFIETDDGALIEFDGRGFGMRGFDPEDARRWHLTMGIRFATTDARYTWLNAALGLWEGIFDERDGRARYRVYVQGSVLK